jgi:hypothetical protein
MLTVVLVQQQQITELTEKYSFNQYGLGVNMSLFDEIIAIYPELADGQFFADCTIMLQDDSDGQPAYIAKWDYSKPIPDGLSLGKPTA